MREMSHHRGGRLGSGEEPMHYRLPPPPPARTAPEFILLRCDLAHTVVFGQEKIRLYCSTQANEEAEH